MRGASEPVSPLLPWSLMMEKVLRWAVLCGIFALPFVVLFVSKSLFFPFITGKNFVFRIIVEIIASLWLSLALVNPRFRPRHSIIFWAIAAFVAIMALANAFGVNPARSFWSNYERMEGWVTLAHLLLYFIVSVSVMKTEELWVRFWQTSLGVSVIVGVYGLLQLAGYITINQGGARLDATFGNATYLAVYMLFHIFIALHLLTGLLKKGVNWRSPLSLVYGGVIALDVFILFFTATRGAMLGLLGGLALAVALVVAHDWPSRLSRYGLLILGIVTVLAGSVWFARDTAFVRSIEPLHRLAFTLDDTTVTARFMNWGMAWQGIQERPILGWGQDNYGVVFSKYYDPGMYAQEPWFDRVHNVVFDWLIAGGFLGLLAYLSIFACALYCMFFSRSFTFVEASLLSGLIGAYFFYLLFTFDNLTSYILFFSVLAYIATRVHTMRESAALWSFSLPQKALPYLAVFSIVLAGGSVWAINADALAQNRALIRALVSYQEGPVKNLEQFKQALAIDSYGTQEVRELLAQGAARLASAQVSDDVKQQFLQLAAEEMKKQSDAVPLEARFPLFLGSLLDSYRVYEDARQVLLYAHQVSPKKQSVLFELGMNALSRQAGEEALGYFKEAYDLAPDYDLARVLYAALAIQLHKDATADELLKPFIEKGVRPEQRIVGAYAARNQFEKIIPLWAAYVEKNPSDAEARFALAATYFAAGNKTASITVLEKAANDLPQLAAQARALIEEIRTGRAKLQ